MSACSSPCCSSSEPAPANAPGRAVEGDIHVGDVDEDLGSWPRPAITVIWEGKSVDGRSLLPVSSSPYITFLFK